MGVECPKCHFVCDMFILLCQQVEIEENCEGFGASPKRKFQYFLTSIIVKSSVLIIRKSMELT
ncbi:hypothetical protein ES703_114694 [subsurface metagenome]